MIWKEIRDIAEKMSGYEGLLMDEIYFIFLLWEEWKKGKIEWKIVENEIEKFKQTLLEVEK